MGQNEPSVKVKNNISRIKELFDLLTLENSNLKEMLDTANARREAAEQTLKSAREMAATMSNTIPKSGDTSTSSEDDFAHVYKNDAA
ncbi:MAG: hypothetical protein RSB41_00590 [Bacilli bacterium]